MRHCTTHPPPQSTATSTLLLSIGCRLKDRQKIEDKIVKTNFDKNNWGWGD